MFVVKIGYSYYSVPDEAAESLFKTLSVMYPLKCDGWGSDRVFQYSDKPLDVEVCKLDGRLIKPILCEFERENPSEKEEYSILEGNIK